MRKLVFTLLAAMCLSPALVQADEYVVDTKGAHAFVQFRTKHLGFSWLYGQFTRFDGEFTYDEKSPEKSSVQMTVDVTSLDTNHGERDKHLRTDEFLNVGKYASATFKSTSYQPTGENTAKLTGDLTLLGVTKEVVFDVDVIGGGRDPWGGYRQGFEARTTISTADFKMQKAAGFPEVELIISIEGCKKPNTNCRVE